MSRRKFTIAVDFDGTIFEHHPDGTLHIGPEIPGAVDALVECRRAGARIILWTCRGSDSGRRRDAVTACGLAGLFFEGINGRSDLPDKYDSPKVVANVYIDDKAYGAPLIYPLDGRRPHIHWPRVIYTLRDQIREFNESQ